ncbi:MAG: MerR family transcriptional regulator [Hyphomicrobiales bacterium]|nr:MerR family transcriptional regulator [Hyphomicrobiales bacterium]
MLIQDNLSSAPLDQRAAHDAEHSAAEAEFVTIGDIARTYGVSLRALRFYEERQLLQPVRRGMARLYDIHARARLELILKGKQLGFTLTEIRAMLENGGDPVQDLKLTLAPAQVLDQIAMLERQRADIEIAIQELRATQERLEDAIGGPAPRRVMVA